MVEMSIKSPVVVVTLRGAGNHGGTLKDPVATTINGRQFLSGTSLSGEGYWSHGQRMHIALDEIAMIVEFESEVARNAGRRRARRGSFGIRRLFGRA